MDQRSSFAFLREYATRWDAIALLIVVGFFAFLGTASRGLLAPLAQVGVDLSLAPQHLPEYAARTTLRMFAAMFLSLTFTLVYATWAAKNERAGRLLIPILDVLQSVPILGFISVTIVFFLSLTPGRVLGAEFAAVFIDWQMPGVAGDALVRALRAVRADIPVVVCSGLGEAPSDTPGLRYLAKPFTFQELGAVVDDVRRALPPAVAVQGNLDPILLTTSPEIVRRETVRILEAMRGARGHVFNLGHGITPEASIECMETLVHTVTGWRN